MPFLLSELSKINMFKPTIVEFERFRALVFIATVLPNEAMIEDLSLT